MYSYILTSTFETTTFEPSILPTFETSLFKNLKFTSTFVNYVDVIEHPVVALELKDKVEAQFFKGKTDKNVNK
uniref:Uncharacterized protein n=1 Tax=Acrobeloides nanus TaxID=290746 RepID=A0A914D6S9_9BILA